MNEIDGAKKLISEISHKLGGNTSNLCEELTDCFNIIADRFKIMEELISNMEKRLSILEKNQKNNIDKS